MRTRRAALAATLSLLSLAVAPAVTATAAPAAPAGAAADGPTRPSPSYDGGGAILNVLPAGAQGTYTTQDYATFQANGSRPPNTVDQLQRYDALTTVLPSQLKDADLPTRYYKDAALGVDPANVRKTETPLPGLRILRDTFGVPHVYGDTYAATLFGAGYAGTEDRMFLQDTLRHVGSARLAEFLGASPGNVAMDQAQLRAAAYTPEQATAQIQNLVRRYGAEGQKYVDGVSQFVAGINAAQKAMCPTFLAPTCPAEYAALQVQPADFTPGDIVYIASLVGGIFGKGGGGEDANAAWLQRLQGRFGAAEGRKVFDDLRESTDPEAPTTSPTPVHFGVPATVTPGANVLPDLDAPVVQRTGERTDPFVGVPGFGSLPPAAGTAGAPTAVDGPFGKIELSVTKRDMSNALLVDAKHSATGHPLAVFGPQVGYFAPQILEEIDLHGPGISAWGSSFAGTQAVVQLGHGVDYAWSATSSDDDNVDVVAEKLCNADGSAPTTASTSYLVDGVCTPMTEESHTELAKPTAGGTALPQQLVFTVEKTRHGIVQYKTTSGGRPIALVVERSTYGGEFDSVVGFARINNPDYVHSAADFKRAFEAVDYTFNWFYADDKDIAYYNSALLPRHAPGVDPSLPRDGSQTRYDNQGFATDAEHPQAVNPAQGYLVSWNNKQAPGFAAADNVWGYGAVYRSLALEDRVKAGIRGGAKMTRVGLVAAMADAATVDVRAAYLGNLVLDVIGDDPKNAASVALLRGWVARGAHRLDVTRSGSYAEQSAIALWDTWWESQTTATKGAVSLPRDVLRPALGDLVGRHPFGVDDHPRQGLGSSWNNVPWYGYVSKDLRRVLGRPVAGAYSRPYCGDLATCRTALRASLDSAVTEVTRAQGKADPATWTYDKKQDDIVARTTGVVGVPNIDWQNRPTFQQVAAFSTHRARPVVPVTAPPAPRKPRPPVRKPTPPKRVPAVQPGRTLAFTGSEAVLPLVAVLLVTGAVVLARRRRVVPR